MPFKEEERLPPTRFGDENCAKGVGTPFRICQTLFFFERYWDMPLRTFFLRETDV